MNISFSPKRCAVMCRIMGFGLLCGLWMNTGGHTGGFFLLLFLTVMTLLRQRFPKLAPTVILDQAACILAMGFWEYSMFALALPVFEAMVLGVFWAVIPATAYLFYDFVAMPAVAMVSSALSGGLLCGWQRDRERSLVQKDDMTRRQYELECLRNDLLTANVQVARMAEISERSRIAREIHDNAGHEIVAAYMSLQTARGLMENENADVLELYDDGLLRLDRGVGKIRETVHNLAPLAELGVDGLHGICKRFSFCSVNFRVFGDACRVPVYVWSVLEPCLNEALTNVMRHSDATKVTVEVDITPHIIRFCVENDGVRERKNRHGIGLRNLRYRAAALGGSLSTDWSDTFRLICVIPLKSEVIS